MEEIPGVAKCFIVIVDKYSYMLGAYTVRSNLEAIECLKAYKSLHAPHAADKVAFIASNVTVITDGAKDTFPEEFVQQVRDMGFNHQFSTAGRPNENGLAELCVRNIVRDARAVLHSSGLPNEIWPYAIQHVLDTRNVLPNKANKGHQSTIYIMTGGVKANYADLVGFGTLCFKHVDKSLRSALDYPGEPCVMIGYKSIYNLQSYKVYSLITGRVSETAD